MFRTIISPILRSTGMCSQFVVSMLPAGSIDTTNCEHIPVLLRMGEIIVRNMLSWLKLLIKLLLLHLGGCLYHYISDARSHKYQNYETCSKTIPIDELTQCMKWRPFCGPDWLCYSLLSHSKVKPVISVITESDLLPSHVPPHSSVKPIATTSAAPLSVKAI